MGKTAFLAKYVRSEPTNTVCRGRLTWELFPLQPVRWWDSTRAGTHTQTPPSAHARAYDTSKCSVFELLLLGFLLMWRFPAFDTVCCPVQLLCIWFAWHFVFRRALIFYGHTAFISLYTTLTICIALLSIWVSTRDTCAPLGNIITCRLAFRSNLMLSV